MTSEYTFKRSNGTVLGTVHALEGNGLGAQAVPRQLIDIDFASSPAKIIVSGDSVSRFAPSALSNVPVAAASNDYIEVMDAAGELSGDSLLVEDDGMFALLPITRIDRHSPMVTFTVVTGGLPGWVGTGSRLSLVSTVELFDGAYDGKYAVATTGATLNGAGDTVIPLHALTPISLPSFDVVGVQAGTHGTITVKGATNSSSLFRVGSVVTLAGNSLPAANKQYTVRSVTVSGPNTIVGVDVNAKKFTIAGNHTAVYISNQRFVVAGNGLGNGTYVVASAALVGANTAITTVGAIPPNTTAGGNAILAPTISRITTEEAGVVGIDANGNITPAAPVGFGPFAAAPGITPTSSTTSLVTWRLSGNHASAFTAGYPVLIRNNNYFKHQELTIQSATYSQTADITNVVTLVDGVTTPMVDISGELVYPAPAIPYGYVRYFVSNPMSSLELVGKGSPAYNSTTTWGEAIQRNTIRVMESFATGASIRALGVTTGLYGKIKLPASAINNNSLFVGAEILYTDDSNIGEAWFTVQSIASVGEYTEITVGETITGGAAGDGVVKAEGMAPTNPQAGQHWYDSATPQLFVYTQDPIHGDKHNVILGSIPSSEPIDMGTHQILNLLDPTRPTDAVNLSTADRLYISKTGGSTADGNVASGTMIGSFNIGQLPAGKSDILSLNVTNAPTRLYGNAGIELDTAGTGNIQITGAGSVIVKRGNVTVGSGTNTAILQNHTAAAPTLTFTTSTQSNAVINLGQNKIVNLSSPSNPTDAANKAYVDGLANGIVWLQPVLDPNLFSVSRTTAPFVTAPITGVTSGATNQWVVAGNHADSFVAGGTISITDNATLTANKTYVVVSADNSGANTIIRVTANTIPAGTTVSGTATDTSIALHKTYIVGAGATGDWVGLDNRAVTYGVTSIDPATQEQTWGWIDILGRVAVPGDRFGVFIEPDSEDPLTVLPTGVLAGTSGKIATITSMSPIAFDFYTPTEPYAFSVTGVSPVLSASQVSVQSPHFGHSYTFRGTWGTGTYGSTYKWIEFAGPSMLTAGGGLRYAGNVLNVGHGDGIIVAADTVNLDTTYVDGLYVRRDGAYPMGGDLSMNGYAITHLHTPSASTDATNKSYVDQRDSMRVATAGDTMDAGASLVFSGGTVTGLSYPSADSDAATKLYTDLAIDTRVPTAGGTMTGSLVLTGASTHITLPNAPQVNTDATNKAYVDGKVALSGGVMTGRLTLAVAPDVPLDAATKGYVDDTTVSSSTSTVMNSGINVTFAGAGEVLGLPATPSSNGSAASKAYVDAQLLSKPASSTVVHLAGTETITGAKTFTASTTHNNQFVVKADATNNNVSVTSTGITLTGTPVTSGGASTISITAGSNTAGVGGAVTIAGGNGSTGGGSVTIAGGTGAGTTGGSVIISAGVGTSTSGQLALVAGAASIALNPTGAIVIGGLVPSGPNQALVSNPSSPTTASPSWQLVGTRVASAPVNSAAPGTIGNWFADDSYLYVFGATGWRRVGLSTF